MSGMTASLLPGLSILAQQASAEPAPCELAGVRRAVAVTLAGVENDQAFFARNPAIVRRIALRDHTRTWFVAFRRGNYCGSGGCTALLLRESGSRPVSMGRIGPIQPPVRILRSAHGGWRDIAVGVGGGGLTVPKTVVLKATRDRYPRNPTMLPVQAVSERAVLEIVMTADRRHPQGCTIGAS